MQDPAPTWAGFPRRRAHEFLTPASIALLYLMASALWILFSDRLVAAISGGDPAFMTRVQTAKGLGFIVGTTLLLYLLMRAGRRALSASERRYREMFALSGAACLLIDEPTGRIVDANAAAEHFYGWSREELLSRRIQDINTLPDELIADAMAAARRRGGEQFTFRHRTAAGDIRDVEVHTGPVEVEGRPMLFSIVHDLTARVAAEQALERSEGRYRSLMAEAPDGFIVTRMDGQFVDANRAACQMLGCEREDLLHHRLRDFVDPLDLAQHPSRMDALTTGRHVLQERVFRRRDGAYFYAEVSARIREDGLVQAVLRDITARRLLEDQLRQAQKMEAVGQLTGGIAHDLNNILGVVLANADLIRHALPPGQEELRQDLDEVRRAALRGAEMIRKLLGFSRQSPLNVAPLDLGVAVGELFSTLRRLLPSHIAMDLTGERAGVAVRADRGALEQILVNLATNARDAMPDGGRLTIAVTRVQDECGEEMACVSVLDTGAGMSPQVRERVFEPFFTTKPPEQGSGLGMAMVYGLVRQMGGSVELESAPGTGTRIRVCLPALPDFSLPCMAATADQSLPRGTETVLVVEDEAPLRSATARILRRLGYTVLAAADGEEALDLVRLHNRDLALVISDIVMPRRSGTSLFHEVRGEGIEVPFLFSSGYAGTETGILFSGEQPPILHKPWSASELAGRVRDLLDSPSR